MIKISNLNSNEIFEFREWIKNIFSTETGESKLSKDYKEDVIYDKYILRNAFPSEIGNNYVILNYDYKEKLRTV